ncbi:serine hydrolase [Sphingomonas qomolangmaensis]|uniref:beta-lactamase n=1 Tax=Sphingomonas qomolangmaensis TaxID=2918765 RepID=A0ABY5L8I8_9SPHN|nr:serine hydrolase [Sphingomonas qomolangmaensis]UUL82004.1 class A beta-lactamase-related serine hydrolase [Sphingomonas qomolangmaensis]
MQFEYFSVFERVLTLSGLAPLALVGCVGGASPELVASLPAPTYRVAAPVPPPPPPPPRVFAPTPLVTAIDAMVERFGGKVGVAVKSIDDDWMISKNGDVPMPQQSVSKLWVAMTALDLVDQGKLRLDEQLTITRADLTLFHQPIAGLLKNGSYTATAGELMRRAMTMSDNTANDRLLRRVGGPAAVNAFIKRKALGAIKFGPGERLLQSRTAGLNWKQDMAMGRAFQAARAKLPEGVRRAAFNNYVADPIDGAAAAAIANALARLKQGDLFSRASTSHLVTLMESSRTGAARLRARVPAGWRLGHKTGTGQDFSGRTAGFNDVGFLTAPNGRSYTIAVLIGDTSRPVRERQQLMQSVVESVVANHRG